jgi:hypothetical protein
VGEANHWQKYADCITRIRYRPEVVDRILTRRMTTGYLNAAGGLRSAHQN